MTMKKVSSNKQKQKGTMENKVKNRNHITIDGWMINKLNLKGNELIIYALIYGFSQDGESEFYGSRSYMAEWCNSSLPTIDKAINELVAKEYILKRTEIINNVTFNRYKINLEVVKKLYRGSKETLQGSKESLHNNIEYNIEDNNNKINKEEELFDYDWINEVV